MNVLFVSATLRTRPSIMLASMMRRLFAFSALFIVEQRQQLQDKTHPEFRSLPETAT